MSFSLSRCTPLRRHSGISKRRPSEAANEPECPLGTRTERLTGPVIAPDSYPALHIYLYSALSWLTDRGKHLERAQWAFAGIYLATMAVVLFGIYRRNKKVSSVSPPFLESKLCCSTRRETTRVPRAETGGNFAPELLFARHFGTAAAVPSHPSARRPDPPDQMQMKTDPSLLPNRSRPGSSRSSASRNDSTRSTCSGCSTTASSCSWSTVPSPSTWCLLPQPWRASAQRDR